MRRARWALGSLLLFGCVRPRTEIVVRVDSELTWGPRQAVQSVVLEVRRGGPSGPRHDLRTTALGSGAGFERLPMLVGVLETKDDLDTPVWVQALGCREATGCTAATAAVAQVAVVRFVREQTLELPMLLAAACAGVTCRPDERCTPNGSCRAATEAQATLVPFAGVIGRPETDAAADVPSATDRAGDRGDDIPPDNGPTTDIPMMDIPTMDIPTMDIPTMDIPTMDIPTMDVGSVIDRPSIGDAVVDAVAVDPGPTDSGRVDDRGVDAGATDLGAPDAGRIDVGAAPGCPAGMLLIPAGRFVMGSMLGTEERPPHPVRMSAFCIDETEATVAAYRACQSAGRCVTPASLGSACTWGQPASNDHPINCVDWSQAQSLCRWRGAELPTEAQWEYAARGTDERIYPWGDALPGAQLCWSGGTSRQGTCPGRAFPAGASPFGVLDMAGNVSEWVLDWYAQYPRDAGVEPTDPTGPATGSFRVLRSGNWYEHLRDPPRAAYRLPRSAFTADARTGFRCARLPD